MSSEKENYEEGNAFSLDETNDEKDGENFVLDETSDIKTDEAEEETEIFTIAGRVQNYICDTGNGQGKGKQGQVYSCTGVNDKKEYAVKIYHDLSVEKKEKLIEKLEILEGIHHPNVCNVIEHGECLIKGELRHYTIMDKYVSFNRKQFRWKEDNEDYLALVVSFVDQMNKALKVVHEKKIYHSDIKPDNIMRNKDTNEFVLIDFGGAAVAQEAGETADAEHATRKYEAPEVVNNKVNEYTDNYSLGIVLAEFINGKYPSKKAELEDMYGTVKRVNFEYYVPENLPLYYVNLIRGLCYQNNDNYEDMKDNRWNDDIVALWVRYMKRGQLRRAETDNEVPEFSYAKEGEASDRGNSKFRFGEGCQVGLSLRRKNGKKKTDEYESLGAVCDAFAIYWEDGIDKLMRSEKFFTNSNVTRTDVLQLIEEGRDNLRYANIKKGESRNAIFFDFIYEYMSEKNRKKFYWGDLPDEHDIESVGIRLEGTLNMGNDFGDWRKKAQPGIVNESETAEIGGAGSNNSKTGAEIFAELFSNEVLSTYLEIADINDGQLREQCRKVEKIFRDKYRKKAPAETQATGICTEEEMVQLYILARLMQNKKHYTLTGYKSYVTYEEFAADITVIATNPDRVHELEGIMSKIKNENGLKPDFVAWKVMQERNAG